LIDQVKEQQQYVIGFLLSKDVETGEMYGKMTVE
jgi:hypothetical protein